MTKLLLLLTLLPFGVFASGGDSSQSLDLTDHWVGYTALILFVIAYIFVMVEEFTHFSGWIDLGFDWLGLCSTWFATCGRGGLTTQFIRIF